jgi:hypothetical protein
MNVFKVGILYTINLETPPYDILPEHEECGGPVSSDRLFGFLSEKIIQFVVVEAVEM